MVYLGRDPKLDRDVAIKVLPDSMASDKERVLRFEREAKLLASLNHTNIAQIYGFEEHRLETGATHFLVLEYVEGETLATRLKRGALPVDETLEICRQIAEALEAAHEKGVIHRDLKPSNVVITPEGTVKVLDFDLAHVTHDHASRRQGAVLHHAGCQRVRSARGCRRDDERRHDQFRQRRGAVSRADCGWRRVRPGSGRHVVCFHRSARRARCADFGDLQLAATARR